MKTQHETEVNALRQQIMTLSAVTTSSQSCSSLPVTLGMPSLAQSVLAQSAVMGQSVVSIVESTHGTVMWESRVRELEQVNIYKVFNTVRRRTKQALNSWTFPQKTKVVHPVGA